MADAVSEKTIFVELPLVQADRIPPKEMRSTWAIPELEVSLAIGESVQKAISFF